MNAFQQWLDGSQEYEAGRLLYAHHGANHQLKRTFSHGPTAYNRSALREELAKLARAGGHVAAPPAAPAAPAVVESVIAAAAPAAPPVAPEVAQLLASLDAQWKPLYKDASHLQAQLDYAPDVPTACSWSHRILDLMDQVQTIWEQQAYVQEHGQLPPAPAPVAPPPALDLSDPAAVLRRRNNLRTQISKQKRNADRAAEVATWQAEIEQLNKILKPNDLSA